MTENLRPWFYSFRLYDKDDMNSYRSGVAYSIYTGETLFNNIVNEIIIKEMENGRIISKEDIHLIALNRLD